MRHVRTAARASGVQNPSADKFGPPPDPAIAQPDRKRRRRPARLVFTVVVLAAAYWVEIVPGHRWFTMFSVIAAFASFILDYALRRHDDGESGDDPYRRRRALLVRVVPKS